MTFRLASCASKEKVGVWIYTLFIPVLTGSFSFFYTLCHEMLSNQPRQFVPFLWWHNSFLERRFFWSWAFLAMNSQLQHHPPTRSFPVLEIWEDDFLMTIWVTAEKLHFQHFLFLQMASPRAPSSSCSPLYEKRSKLLCLASWTIEKKDPPPPPPSYHIIKPCED